MAIIGIGKVLLVLLPTLWALSIFTSSISSFSWIMPFNIFSVCSHVSFSTSCKPSILRLSRRDLSSMSLSFSQRYSFSCHNSLISLLFCCLSFFSFWFFSLNFSSVISCDLYLLNLRSSVSLLKLFNLMLLSLISYVNRSKRALVSEISFRTIFKSLSSCSLNMLEKISLTSSIDKLASLVLEWFFPFHLLYFWIHFLYF